MILMTKKPASKKTKATLRIILGGRRDDPPLLLSVCDLRITSVTQLLELDQENLIHSNFFYNIMFILFKNENMCI